MLKNPMRSKLLLWKDPTRCKQLILFIGIILSGIFVTLYGGVISYTLFYFMLSVPVFSVVYMLYVYIRFRVYQLIDKKTVVKGEHIPYQFILANEDFITYTGVSVTFLHTTSEVDRVDAIHSYYLLPGDQFNYKTTLTCRYRGEYLAGIDKVQISDFLGIFHMTYPSPSTINVRVLPRQIHLKQLVFFSENNALLQLQNQPVNPTVPDSEVRNYVSSDPMKRIQWKATAREQKLLTRKYMEEKAREVVLFIDTSKANATEMEQIITEDKIIESSLAIAWFFLSRNISMSIHMEKEGRKSLHIHNKEEYDLFYAMSCDLIFRGNKNVSHLLNEIIRSNSAKKYCIIVTHTISDELSASAYQALHFGNEVILVYINKNRDNEVIGHMDKRIHLYHIPLDAEVSDILDRKA